MRRALCPCTQGAGRWPDSAMGPACCPGALAPAQPGHRHPEKLLGPAGPTLRHPGKEKLPFCARRASQGPRQAVQEPVLEETGEPPHVCRLPTRFEPWGSETWRPEMGWQPRQRQQREGQVARTQPRPAQGTHLCSEARSVQGVPAFLPGRPEMLLQLSHLPPQLQNLQVHLVQLVGKLSLDGVHVQGLLQHLGGRAGTTLGRRPALGEDGQLGRGQRRTAVSAGRAGGRATAAHPPQPQKGPWPLQQSPAGQRPCAPGSARRPSSRRPRAAWGGPAGPEVGGRAGREVRPQEQLGRLQAASKCPGRVLAGARGPASAFGCS